jgi:predicted HTH transcriptional regulator
MKQLKNDVQALSKSLRELTRRTEQIAKKLEKLEKPKGKLKARPKSAKATASEIILSIIKRSRKGVNSATLQKKTGFNNQKIRDNIYKLSKRGKIKKIGTGVYVSAQ